MTILRHYPSFSPPNTSSSSEPTITSHNITPTPHPQLKPIHSTNAATAPNPATNPPTTTRPAAFDGLVRTPVPVGATEGLNGPFGVAVAIATDVTGNTPVGTAPLTPGVTDRNCVELTSAPGGAVLGA